MNLIKLKKLKQRYTEKTQFIEQINIHIVLKNFEPQTLLIETFITTKLL